MLLADVARTSGEVAATSARSEKVAALARLFARTPPDEAPVVITYLAGRLPQRRTGLGWSALRDGPPPAPAARLEVREVHTALDRIAAVSGKGAAAERARLLGTVLAAATAEEQWFLRRLIGGELRQGALDALAVEGLAAAVGAAPEEVRRAVMLGGSLGAVARELLARGPAALADFRLEVGRPVLPMLAQSAKDVDEALDRLGPCAVEEKLDGIRVQVHRDGTAVRVFTRTLDEITGRLPDVVAAARELAVDRAVLDGEVIALGPDGRPRPFQEVAGRVGSRLDVPGAQQALPLSPVFFDLLSVDGRDLLALPTAERHAELARVAPEHRRVRRMVAADPVAEETRRAVREFAARVLAEGHEGVLVKALDAPYGAGRRGASWLKVKPVHTLDLVVLAAEWGHGRRTGKLSNLHLGARRPDGTFVMLGKTFKGLTDAVLEWQTRELRRIAVGDDGHVVRVRPELVVEVAFDGLQRSSRYPAGVTLRFARVVRYREDKPAAEADTVETVLALRRPDGDDAADPPEAGDAAFPDPGGADPADTVGAEPADTGGTGPPGGTAAPDAGGAGGTVPPGGTDPADGTDPAGPTGAAPTDPADPR
ncbi:ATP-dependent DNA ligase [Streptomyces pactum]|uniref:ATP-dependent DNA ligase n=1 Tax=Streptomyces pactum TaxID=68249 RepID=UPI0036F80736